MRFLPILFITIVILLGLSNKPLLAQNESLETAGDIILFALPVAVLTTTFIKGDTKGSWQFAKGLLLTEAVTFGLKAIIEKDRPDSSGTDSFPSGHTSTTFHSAAFVHRRYGFKYSIPAYALAGFTAASRLAADKHDGWDVLGGVIIGVGSAFIFTTEYQKEHMELTFTKHKSSYLLGFNYKF